MYNASIAALKNVRPHPNADRVKLATVCGTTIVVGLDSKEGDLGIYFPTDGVITSEFLSHNNLFREASANRDPKAKPGMFDLNGRVRTQKFRGEISDGFWIPLDSLDGFVKNTNLPENFEFNTLEEKPICFKYVNKKTQEASKASSGKKTRVAKSSIMFKEHFDTDQFGRNIFKINRHDTAIVTLKVHGTSGRIGHVLMKRELPWYESLLKKIGVKIQEEHWSYLNGTRRVVLGESKDANAYHDPTIREKAFELFNGKLKKGETVYFEIVGFESPNKTIMSSASVDKKTMPEVYKQYGPTINYTYGCDNGQSAIYVYRITMTTVEGESRDLTWNEVQTRCEQMGVKHVPMVAELNCAEIPGESRDEFEANLLELMTGHSEGPDLIDQTHIREGVCIRVDRPDGNLTLKHKSFTFKVLEGMVKDSGVIDLEEAS